MLRATPTPFLGVTQNMNTPISALLERKGSALHTVSATITIAAAVTEMNRNRVGSVLVVEGGALIGIFTERDVLRRVVGAGIDPKVMRVCDVMTKGVLTVAPEATVEEVMGIFTEKRCRHLPVMKDGQLLGMVSIGDASRWLSDLHRDEAQHLKSYIAGGLTA